VLVMVLNDGETFSNLNGCMIVEVPEATSVEEIVGMGYPVLVTFDEVEDVPDKFIEMWHDSIGEKPLERRSVFSSPFKKGS
jgi:hypothetical protein